jgi:hypothetical protein
MSEMIEKAAKAMREMEIARDRKEHGERGRLASWDDLAKFDGSQDIYRDLARAAIEAMREPTQAMLDTVTAYDQEEPFSDATMRSVYQEMIGAALTDRS